MSWYLREGYPTAYYQSVFIVSLAGIITQFASISFASYIVGGTKYSTMKAYSCVIIFLTAVMATGVRGERYLRAEISNEEENDMMMSFNYHQPVGSYRTFRNSNDDIDMSAKEERATAVAMQAVVPSNSLTNQIICGYQGWYAYPGM